MVKLHPSLVTQQIFIMNNGKSLEDRIVMLGYSNRLQKAAIDGLNHRVAKIEKPKKSFLQEYESQRDSSARNLAVVNVGRVPGQKKMANENLGPSVSLEEGRWGQFTRN
ncbi:hypothetical protein LTS18_006574 [Coniosporium uncinatum]|uniref:Uncharacterized protein n=1 Tax=Coniosporium uncinatum TaxID=93489 RepID=A0ACC3DZL2_9PEZI|nr:hypothetical protein LTS18_006574 [Coniosporium uncinatum]